MVDKLTANPADIAIASMPANRHATVVPSNSASLPPHRALYIAVTGDVAIEDANGTQITYASVAVGLFPFVATKIRTATTATVVLWW